MKRNSKENSEELSKSLRTVLDRIRTPFAGKVVVMDTEGSAPAPHEGSREEPGCSAPIGIKFTFNFPIICWFQILN